MLDCNKKVRHPKDLSLLIQNFCDKLRFALFYDTLSKTFIVF